MPVSENPGEMLNVLLLTADPLLVSTFTSASKELGIEAQCADNCQQISEQIGRAKYQGVVLDFDTVSDARPALASVRESPSNKNAIVFAVATSPKRMDDALADRAHFLLRRPIETATVKATLYTAYDLMLGQRRRHFRCTAQLTVRLTATNLGVHLECLTMNISSNGMGVRTPVPFKPAETLDIALRLPDGFTVRAMGIVVWDDKHGKCGLNFQCSTPEMRHMLDSWLDSQFASTPLGQKEAKIGD